MSALAEALVAAQRQAVGSLTKAYVAGAFEEDGEAGLPPDDWEQREEDERKNAGIEASGDE